MNWRASSAFTGGLRAPLVCAVSHSRALDVPIPRRHKHTGLNTSRFRFRDIDARTDLIPSDIIIQKVEIRCFVSLVRQALNLLPTKSQTSENDWFGKKCITISCDSCCNVLLLFRTAQELCIFKCNCV